MQQQHARGPGRMQQQHAEPRRAANSKTSRMQPARDAGARGRLFMEAAIEINSIAAAGFFFLRGALSPSPTSPALASPPAPPPPPSTAANTNRARRRAVQPPPRHLLFALAAGTAHRARPPPASPPPPPDRRHPRTPPLGPVAIGAPATRNLKAAAALHHPGRRRPSPHPLLEEEDEQGRRAPSSATRPAKIARAMNRLRQGG